jgi:hypothetical protein
MVVPIREQICFSMYIRSLAGVAVFLVSSVADAVDPVRATKPSVAERNVVLRENLYAFCRG